MTKFLFILILSLGGPCLGCYHNHDCSSGKYCDALAGYCLDCSCCCQHQIDRQEFVDKCSEEMKPFQWCFEPKHGSECSCDFTTPALPVSNNISTTHSSSETSSNTISTQQQSTGTITKLTTIYPAVPGNSNWFKDNEVIIIIMSILMILVVVICGIVCKRSCNRRLRRTTKYDEIPTSTGDNPSNVHDMANRTDIDSMDNHVKVLPHISPESTNTQSPTSTTPVRGATVKKEAETSNGQQLINSNQSQISIHVNTLNIGTIGDSTVNIVSDSTIYS
ncbi:uncharacterized protein LOC102809893 [Saccoglossus kowalevskii]|uniref:Uncharacterized protein LOC102809893 n=1 Tax=Saccoglossus kowalevskii TaxID=10224 RepID=A0ABM0MUV6_SACKO|nr:PREDICTED: uncharacterized protein LOC102809893 [Saccoglossus kowalevskii]